MPAVRPTVEKSRKEQVREILKKIPECLKGGNSYSRGFVVLRFHDDHDRDQALELIPKTFPNIPWEIIDLTHDLDGSTFQGHWMEEGRNRFMLFTKLPCEIEDSDGEEARFLKSLDRNIKVELPRTHRAVLCILSNTVKSLVDKAPKTWKSKLGYMAWPLREGVTEEGLGLRQRGEVAEEAPRFLLDPAVLKDANSADTKVLLKRLVTADSARYLVELARQHLESGDVEMPRVFLLRAVEIFFDHSDLDGVALSYHMLGRVAAARADYQAAVEWLEQAIENWKVTDNQISLSDSISFIGYIHYMNGDYEKSIRAFNEGLQVDKKLGDEDRISAGYRKKAMVFEKVRNYARAHELYQTSLDLEHKRDNKDGVAKVYHHLGRMEEDRENWPQALLQYEKSLDLRRKMENFKEMSTTLHQMGNLHTKSGEISKAIQCYIEALELEKKLKDHIGFGQTLAQLGLARLLHGTKEPALRNLVKAYNILNRGHSPYALEILNKIKEMQDQVPPEVFEQIINDNSVTLEL